MSGLPFKICVSGTHSTGKSTLIQKLKANLDRLELRVGIVADQGLHAEAAGLPILTDQTEESTFWIMAESIRLEAMAALANDVVLIDRAIFDAVGYFEAALHISGRKADTVRLRTIKEIARSYSKEYDILVVTKLEDRIPLGPGRDQNKLLRKVTAEAIMQFAQSLGRAFETLTSRNSDEIEGKILAIVCQRLGIGDTEPR